MLKDMTTKAVHKELGGLVRSLPVKSGTAEYPGILDRIVLLSNEMVRRGCNRPGQHGGPTSYAGTESRVFAEIAGMKTGVDVR